MCNDCINDLKNNRRSIYKRILNLNNIKKLISYSLGLDDNNDDNLRYPYYSCELLCSPCILKFSKSIKHIIDAINFEKKMNNQKENQETEFFENLKNENDEIFYYDEASENVEEKKSELADFMNEEIYDFEKDKLIQSELQKTTMRTAENSNFEKEETNIIDEILETIFSFLDSTLLECETYVGYFNKIINYLMINEPIITTKFIFENNKNIITKFSEHMNNDSIQNIFENLLNYLSDQEESNKGPSQFNSIIMNLLKDINNITQKDIKDDINLYYKDKNKIDFICELIINTLINNTSKNFIQLILPSTNNNNFMDLIKSLISDAVKPKFNENHHKKNVIINLIEVLGQINSIIMHSKKIVNNKLNEDMAFFNEHYKKIKAFEYQYFSRKTINYDDIFSAFDKNNKLNNSYISIIKDIYGLIINDIKNNYNNKNVKSLMFLYEWKYILSSLKLFIFQFYAFKNFDIIDGTNDFYDKELFDLSIKLYFQSNTNNIYQNIFIDIIKLINYEKTPKYLINDFIEKQHLFIDDIKKIVNEKNKYNILLGLDIQILLLFYNSFNPASIDFYNKLKNLNSNNNLDILEQFMISIKPNFERQLKENYIFTEMEIFDGLNYSKDSADTFDGNDMENSEKMKKYSLKTIVKNYIENLSFLFTIKKLNSSTKSKLNSEQSVKEYSTGENGSKITIKETKETIIDKNNQISYEIAFDYEDKKEKNLKIINDEQI